MVDILGSIDNSIENNEKIIQKTNELALSLIHTIETPNTELKGVIKFIKGKKPLNNNDSPAPYLSIEAITSGIYEESSSIRMIMAKPFDILMVMDGASSGTVYSHQEGIVSSTLAKVEVDDALNDYIYWYLVSMKDTIKIRNTGSAIPHANKDYIGSLKFNIDIASNITLRNQLHELRSEIISLQQKNKKLKELKQYYLKKFFN